MPSGTRAPIAELERHDTVGEQAFCSVYLRGEGSPNGPFAPRIRPAAGPTRNDSSLKVPKPSL
jgi:hypothetical protein